MFGVLFVLYYVLYYSPANVDLQELFPCIKPKIVFCQKSCEKNVKDVFQFSNLNGTIVLFDDKDADIEAFIKQYNGTEINFTPAQFDPSNTNAWLILTSGTTGLPKVAVLTYDTLLNNICCWFEPFTDKYDIVLTMSTLQWLSAAIYFISGPLRCFTRLQSSAPLTPQSLLSYINKYKPNSTVWTPHLLGQFLTAAENGLCDLSSFKGIAIGGSSIEKTLLDKFRQICPAFLYLVYSMTELMVPVFDFSEDTPENSVGSPKDKYTFKLIDEDGHTIEKPYKAGELWIKGDDFFKGYLNNPEETKKMLTEDGWLKTGDIFQRDEQDYYYFVERKRLLIRYSGYFISPLEIEKVIKSHPGVSDACVVGIPNPSTVELPIAAIQRRNGDKIDPEEIFTLLKNTLPDRKQIHGGLFFVDSFPITPSGKINRAKVRDLALTSLKILPK